MGRHVCAFAVAVAAALASAPASAAPCVLAAPSEPVAVERALDGDTVLLDDGRTVRLAGIAAPKAPLGTTPADWPLDGASTAALEALSAGRVWDLRETAGSPDRHGRLLGYLAGVDETDHAGLAAALLARGLVRASGDASGRDCRATLAAAEAPALAARLGLWSEPYYVVRQAVDGQALAALAGRFVVAEGRVKSVRTSAGRAYVNFGTRWRGALSLSLSEAALRKLGGFEGLGVAVGARIRARGVLEARPGPTIYVTEPGQVERIEVERVDDAGRKR